VVVTEAASRPVSTLLEQARTGDRQALEELLPILYTELRRIAGRYIHRERPGQTLQATALVHEAYLRLLREGERTWQNRTHFIAIAACSMRQILIERARARGALKRGGDRHRLTLHDGVAATPGPTADLLALDEALTRLADLDPQQARIVELRYFGGLTIEETAEELGVSPATVKRGWSVARAWLHRELTK
jgi:RNA polymerase sigma factor (TIGR02999 family)